MDLRTSRADLLETEKRPRIKIARGLARLWLVLSVLWAAFIIWFLIFVEEIHVVPPGPDRFFADIAPDYRDLQNTLAVLIGAALGPPALVLALGSALVWAFRGFRE